jgi:hypothetical protein
LPPHTSTRRPPCPSPLPATPTSPPQDGSLTTPSGSPKILIHTRQGKIVGVYCDQSAKALEVETQDSLKRAANPRYQAFCSVICPQTSVKVVGGYGTSIAHMLAMAFDDSSMDDDLRQGLAAHEIILEDEWADVVRRGSRRPPRAGT